MSNKITFTEERKKDPTLHGRYLNAFNNNNHK